jgi:hypothetical protein
MSLSPRDMDFIALKNMAAREIALALGVPSMLLGIPGDSTHANYAEANRVFWRQTVIPLVQRSVSAMSEWLTPGFGRNLELRPDIDQLDALAPDRDAQWARLQATTFLTDDEKRSLVGYGPKPPDLAAKLFNPGQPRDNQGRWSGEGDGAIVEPTAGKKPYDQPAKGKGKFQKDPNQQPDGTTRPPDNRENKVPVPNQSGKDGSKDIPKAAEGQVPKVGESSSEFAQRVLEDYYKGQKDFKKGPNNEFSEIEKWAERHWQNPSKRK